MLIGIPRETKTHEYRVSLLPVGADLLTQRGHTVLVQRGAGQGSGYEDAAYEAAGAELVDTAAEVFARSEMIVKVKEPLPAEVAMLRPRQVVFTYFHFAADRDLTLGCLEKNITAIAYETLTDASNRLPLLTPMSEVAGRMAVQEGAKCLEKPQLGRGILLSGVTGVEPAKVTILGGGIVGINAAKIAAGIGADVVIMDVSLDRMRYLDDVMPANVSTIYSEPHAIAEHVTRSDLVIGAVLIPGARSPILIHKALLKDMLPATVAVCEPAFELRMWRGPTWNSMTWWAAQGTIRYGRADAACSLLEAALDQSAKVFERTGTIWEFYHPMGGRPEDVQRKPQTPYNMPCKDYLGHNPLIAMAKLYSETLNSLP